MGLLDEVIGAALGSRAGSGQPTQAQAQATQAQPTQDQYSQIAAALTKLLAPRAEVGTWTGRSSNARSADLDVLMKQFQQNGFGEIINSWIGTGQNRPISANQLRQALGQETVTDLSQQTATPHDDLLSQLAKLLPRVIDRLTPNGQLPTHADLLQGPRSR